MANEAVASLPYPLASAIPDIPADLLALVNAVAPRLNLNYSSTSTRDAAIPSPSGIIKAYTGSRTSTTDTLWEFLFDGYQWVVLTSPWQAITVNTGGGFSSSSSPSVRMMGGLVTFKGTIGGAMASTSTTYTIGTVPTGFRPPALDGRSVKSGSDVSSGAGFPFLCVDTAGNILVRTAVTGTPQVSLGGLSGYSVL